MIAYLDTNLFDHLYKKIGCTAADIADLRKAVYGRDLSIPLGIHVLEELLLNQRASPQELVARVKLTLSIASIRRMVKPCDQLIADDIRSYAAAGEADRPLVNVQIQNAITQGIAELIESDGEEFSEEIADALQETRRRKERFVNGMNITLQELASLTAPAPANVGFAEYFDRSASAAAELLADRVGVLDACRDRGIAGLLEIRSVRALVGSALSFVYGQALADAPASADPIDFVHLPSAAATAELFVTNDNRLREVLARIPFDNLRPMNLAEFLATNSSPTE
jgi:hypothetical protein